MKQEKIKYINHIQILRAFSVLLVFFYHCNLVFFNNGYLGVDIFFIISGFVITKLLEQNFFKNKSYELKNFYLKRIRKIFPAYFFIIVIFCLFFLFIGPLTDLDYIIKKIVYLITFTTNFYYLNYSNKEYFDNIFQDPLNHTWSLAVEMQFYLFFPFLIFFLKKYFNRKHIQIILTLIIIFGIFFTFFFFENINLSFYSPLFRFWEFLLGSLAYYLHTKNNLNIENKVYLFYFVLFFIIIFSNANYRFFNLLSITTITFFFLLLKKNQSHLNSIFNNNILLNLGNISYSFYLWHLPILYFFNIYFENKVKFIFAFLVTYLLSYFSFFFIEQKFKNFKINIINQFFFLSIACILLISGTIKIYYYEIKNFIISHNYLEKKFSLTKRINYTEIKINNNEIYKFCTTESKNYNLNHYSLRKECLKITDKETLIYVEGDSHTAMFLPLILAYDKFKNIYYVHNNSNYFYKEVNNQLKNFKNILYVRSINSLDELNYFKKNLQSFDKRISFLIITPIPNYYNDKIRAVECLIQNKDCFFAIDQDYKIRNLNKFYKKINELKESKENLIFFDSYQILCPEKNCYIYNNKNKLLTYRDGTHLTIEGSLSLKKNFDLLLNSYLK